MRTPTPRELLQAWDDASTQPRARRAASVLWPATGLPSDAVETLSVGECNRLLVEVRQRLFGDRLRTLVECPGCGVVLDVVLAASDLLEAPTGPGVVETALDGYRVRCREPSTRDLIDAAQAPSAADARALLLARSVVAAERDGTAVDASALPDAVVAAASDALARAHPLLDVDLPLECEECGERWSRPFDIGAYLWEELDAWALRTLGEVHALASAYGWSEPDVLALPPRRRRHYLELAGHG